MATEAAKAIEAILMVAQEPVDPHLLAQLLEVAPARVSELCDELRVSYEAEDRGFVLVKVAGGYRFQSHGDLAAYVERFVLEGQTARLSSAALETLAIVAYKQPISRAQVAAIRGVNVDGVMRTLQQRGYIDEVGRDPGPGQATLFGTTREFLERLGIDRVEDLPSISDLFPSAEVMEALEHGLRAEPRAAAEAAAATELAHADPVTFGGFEPAPADLAASDAPGLEGRVDPERTAGPAEVAEEAAGAEGGDEAPSAAPPAAPLEIPDTDLPPPAWFVELESAESEPEADGGPEPEGDDPPARAT